MKPYISGQNSLPEYTGTNKRRLTPEVRLNTTPQVSYLRYKMTISVRLFAATTPRDRGRLSYTPTSSVDAGVVGGNLTLAGSQCRLEHVGISGSYSSKIATAAIRCLHFKENRYA